MKNKGLTITMVIEAESANYGEGYNNITTLKKLTRGDGNAYTYISRQALRYNIVEQMKCNDTPVEPIGTGEKKVIQFHPDCTIKDYPEIDLFGYMKTKGGDSATTRNAVVRLSNAISLEEFESETDFLTNMGLAKRIGANNSIAQSEIHKSYYAYTVTIDLDKVGVDKDIDIGEEEKKKRIKDNNLDVNMLKAIIESDEDVKTHTKVGYIEGKFENNNTIKEILNAKKVNEVFDEIIKEVEEEC